MFSNTPAASAQFVRNFINKHPERTDLRISPEFQRLANSYDYYNQEFLPHQFDKIPKGTVGPGGARFGEYTYKSSDASKKIAAAPGAGLWAMGIDPNSPDAERQAQAFIDNNTNRQYEGLRMTAGNWGRADAELPNLLQLKQQNPNLTATQLLDYQSRGGHMQSSLPPRAFDIADALVPLGEIALGWMGGPVWGPALAAGLGGGYGLANNGLVGGILGAAGGYGGGSFGADIGTSGLSAAISNQIPNVSNLTSGSLTAALPSTPTTASGWLGSAADTINSIPSFLLPSDNKAKGIGSLIPTAAFGAQAAGALNPTKPVTPTPAPAARPVTTTPTPLAVNPFNLSPTVLSNIQNRTGAPATVVRPTTTATTPVTRAATPTTMPFNLAALQQKFNPTVVKKAAGGMLPTSKTEMNPMGGAPASTYGLASFMPEVRAKGGYLDGPGDGMSDSIPATIEDKQPARLADGEFVIPADVVSHIGNGSSKAGAKRLYAMMDKIRHARTGSKKQGKQINSDKYLPA